MNHTHYALFNEDNVLVAIFKRPTSGLVEETLVDQVTTAIEDEYGQEALRLTISPVRENEEYNVDVKFADDGYKERLMLKPTWEY